MLVLSQPPKPTIEGRKGRVGFRGAGKFGERSSIVAFWK
jgi:hypothetical protein